MIELADIAVPLAIALSAGITLWVFGARQRKALEDRIQSEREARIKLEAQFYAHSEGANARLKRIEQKLDDLLKLNGH